MERLKRMSVFAKVVEFGSFTAAARQLQMSVSSISQTVSKLEDELQVKLLNRSTRSIGLTEAGRIYYQGCRRMLHEVQDVHEQLYAFNNTPIGTLRIGCSSTMAQNVLAGLTAKMLKEYPGLSVNLVTGIPAPDLIANGLDVVIRVGALQDSSLFSRRLGAMPMVVCAIMADLLFSPRSIKQEVDRELESLLVAQYQLMQLCIKHGDGEVVDKAWGDLVRRTTALQGMRSNLNMESSRWARANRRLKAINTLSLTLITQSCETYLIQNTRPELITDTFREFFDTPVETAQDVHKQLKRLRRVIAWTGERETPVTIYSWVAAATRYQLLKRGVISNTKINATEEEILQGEPEVKVESAERHHAMVNFWRTTLSCILGTLFWLWTGWTSGSGAMVMIAVVTSLAMRLPNPRMVAIDFIYGTLAALPLGLLYFLVIIPNTQQSMLLLCISLAVLGFFLGIEVQKRRLGSMGALASTINIIVLDNPMTFHFSIFRRIINLSTCTNGPLAPLGLG
jgi:DNA-binding transcriptional LysR family regulator